MKHFIKKSRYRICFQTKNKVWLYKNSRLRNFYKIRNKIILQTGRFAKNFLITKNMKWTVARRNMVPYLRTKNKFYFFYKNLFFTKQQLKNFYGGLKEYQIRNIFKQTWNREQFYKTNIFISALEQRLPVVLYRMRLLPTIFACNQLIQHHGILVNDNKINLINYRVKLGDIVSISEDHWHIFYEFLFERLRHRNFGHSILIWRKQYLLKKIHFYQIKKKNFYVSNFKLLQKFNFQKNHFKFLRNYMKFVFNFLKNQPKDNSILLNNIKFLYFFLEIKIFNKLKKLENTLVLLHQWSKPSYHLVVKFILINLYNIKFLLSKINLILYKFLLIENLKIFQQHILEIHGDDDSYLENSEFLNNFITQIIVKKYFVNMKNFVGFKFKFSTYLEKGLKIFHGYKSFFYKNKQYINFFIKRLKYRKLKRKIFKNWSSKIRWYTPSYLEIDYQTLRAAHVYYPEPSEIHFGFLCSFKKIISFYKERAL